MRSHCPICKSTHKTSVLDLSFVVPDGWTLPDKSTVYECAQCRFTYYDNAATPLDYDVYYRERYGYGVGGADTEERMTWTAKFISDKYGAHGRILDYGAEDPQLIDDLNGRGFHAEMYNMGDDRPTGKYDAIILSHVLEHVYDLNGVMLHVMGLLDDYGIVYVEVPNHAEWGGYHSPLLGFHQKHINHFRPHNLDTLFGNYGMGGVWADDYWIRRQSALRRVYQRQASLQTAGYRFMGNMQNSMKLLEAIDHPVNVWGLGDIAWYLLAKADIEVVNYIDNDPAYRGATIKGQPVLERPDNDHPIVVMAVGQAKALIERIKSECDNEVVVI